MRKVATTILAAGSASYVHFLALSRFTSADFRGTLPAHV
jgi:hypothetical protein